MSLATTLGTKLRTPIHHHGQEVTTAAPRPRTRAEGMAGGGALTRHAVLATLAAGGATYGVLLLVA